MHRQFAPEAAGGWLGVSKRRLFLTAARGANGRRACHAPLLLDAKSELNKMHLFAIKIIRIYTASAQRLATTLVIFASIVAPNSRQGIIKHKVRSKWHHFRAACPNKMKSTATTRGSTAGSAPSTSASTPPSPQSRSRARASGSSSSAASPARWPAASRPPASAPSSPRG